MSIDKDIEAKILRYHFVEQWKVGTISTQLGLHHSVVDRVLSQAGLPKIERSVRSSIIDPFLPFIVETLQSFPSLTAARLYDMVRQRGYLGGPSLFRQRISQLRPRKQPEAYLRLKTLPGEQAQVDWGLCRARHNPHYADNQTMPSTTANPLYQAISVLTFSA